MATVAEKDLGSTPAHTGTFTVTDASILATSELLVWQVQGPYTGKGTRADEAEMDDVRCIAYPSAGAMTVRWFSDTFVKGNFKFAYLIT